jgi:hypothetical protein
MRPRSTVLGLVLLLSACAGNGAPDARSARPSGPTPVDGTPVAPAGLPDRTHAVEVPPPDDPTSGRLSGSERERAARLKGLEVPGWTWFEEGERILFLRDEKAPEARLRSLARRIRLLIEGEFARRYPSAGPPGRIYVFRVCKDVEQYRQYGGPGGSSGYWSPTDREVVGFHDPVSSRDSLRTLQGMALLQYLHVVGAGMAHDWFGSGLSDCFGWSDVREDGRVLFRPNGRREDQARKMSVARKHAPLREFVRYEHTRFYGPEIQENFARAWSLCWFLLRTEERRWTEILPKYFLALRDSAARRDREALPEDVREGSGFTAATEAAAREDALAAAFEGFDDAEWKRLEEAWLASKW